MDNFNWLHLAPNIEVVQWQELMSMSDDGSRIVAVRDEANNLCPVLFPHATAGSAFTTPLNLPDELGRLMQARTGFQHRFDTPPDAAVHVQATRMGYSKPVPKMDGQPGQDWSHGIFLCEFNGPRPRKVRFRPRAMAQH